MKKFFAILMAVLCMCLTLTALADVIDADALNLSVNGTALSSGACSNADGAICLPLLPVAEALGYTVDMSELSEGDAYRVVYTLTPAPFEDGTVGAQLMVAYSIEDGKPTAVAVSKDQILLPLKQSMTLNDDEPYLPTEFFETGMCASFTLDSETQTLDIATVCMG